MKVLAISDVSIGYGSLQIPKLVDFLGNHFQSEKIIIEPDQIEKAPRHNLYPEIKIHRLIGSIHPHSNGGRIEYVLNASRLINKIKPEILIICTTFTLPIIFKINYKPKKIIYYSMESISHYVGDLEMNKIIDNKIDFVIFPETNRARIHLETTGIKTPFCLVYNCVNGATSDFVSPQKRNGKIIYQGGLHDKTAFQYYLDKKTQNYPIDLYGLIESEENKMKIESKFHSLTGNVQYLGYISAQKLTDLRKSYSYGIVIWLPTDENTTYACPNKFFELISSGVPPITAPIPQCKEICERYNCGIVMNDFSIKSFLDALEQAMTLDDDTYEQMVENCKKAVEQEFNWPLQMKKVTKLLDL